MKKSGKNNVHKELMDEYRASELFDTNKIFEGIEDEIDNVIKEQKL